jgi:Fic family protein
MGPLGFRASERTREGAPPPPSPALIEGRLALLEQWLGSRSAEDLQPEQAAALALARIVEVLPFEDGNGRVARLAASHLMVQGGKRPPILVAADGPRLVAALQSAFALHTEPLGTLLEEASGRALDVMLQALEKGEI